MKGYIKTKFGYRQIAQTGIGDIEVRGLKIKVYTKPFQLQEHSFKNINQRNLFIKQISKQYANLRRKTEPYTVMM